ncbi:MAG: hypothetical protein DMF64_01765 [Acidobacteria bacterium]|nr:MAG: hypothetical protein DMF64_01765 [Acidobacteriota bacterium]
MNLKRVRQWVALLALLSLIHSFNALTVCASGNNNATAPLIQVTPPEPVFNDEARRTELAARRAHVAEQIGPKSVLVLFSTEARVYTGDVDYEYRQENNFYYLTNLNKEGATLVLMPGHKALHEILFLPRRRRGIEYGSETWTGRMYSPEEAQSLSGIAEIWDAREFAPFMRALKAQFAYQPKPENVFLSAVFKHEAASSEQSANVNADYETLFSAMRKNDASVYLLIPEEQDSRAYKQEQTFAAQLAQSASGFTVRNAWPIFAEMRVRKSPMELQLLQHAVDISIEAHESAQASAAHAQWEYEVAAEVDYTFRRRHADHWGYPLIVGSGVNATTLHYEEAQGPVKAGDLLLMDVGAEYGHYTADVTRTFPVNGHFSPAQADIYNIVLAAQEKAMSVVHPGATFADVHNAAVEVLKDGLFKLGLITERNSSQYRLWFMHGTSHFLGMDVHDVGGRIPLEPNMCFTIEPGIYIRPDALDLLPDTPDNRKFIIAVRPAFEKYKGSGVRIEDDILVTPAGYRNMSGALPRTIPDIENFLARAARELHNEPR